MRFLFQTIRKPHLGSFLAFFLLLNGCDRHVRVQEKDAGIAASGSDVEAASSKSRYTNVPRFCGGELSKDAVPQFLALIVSRTTAVESSVRDSKLFNQRVSLTIDGKTSHFERETLASYEGRLPSPIDWKEISQQITKGELVSVGWRGCIIGNGKAAFQADEHGALGLSAFDFDASWGSDTGPAKGVSGD